MARLAELKEHIDEQAQAVIYSLAASIEARDASDGGHGERVSAQCVRFAKCLGLDSSDIESLRVGGLVHDIGKIGVPESILCKPGPLNPAEIIVVRQHPALGEDICAPMSYFRNVLPIIRSHHERLDGSGYPDGLHGEQIPMLVRILQIVDICDALTANRAYRVSLSLSHALITLYEEADRGWLDEELVGKFASFVIGSQRAGAADRKSRMLSSVETGKRRPSIATLGQISA